MSESDGFAECVGQAFFPLDERLGIRSYQQTSRRLERLVCAVGIRLPYEQVSAVIADIVGVGLAGRQVERIIDRQGQRAIVQRDAEVKEVWNKLDPIGRQPVGPDILYIEADGAWINSREQGHIEGKVGLVHQGPHKIGQDRMRLREAVYVTTFQSFERLGEELYLEADRQGLEQAGRVIFLSDGATSLRDIHQTHFQDARYVLDWFHLRRALYQALRGVAVELGDDYEAAARMTLKDLLWFGEVDLVLERLDRLRGMLAGGQARDALTRFKGYLLNNREGIGYVDLAEQGVHVGSGPIEKAGDLIINRRCELRGMAWYRHTADGICNLRALYLNNRWHSFWES